MQDTSRNSSGFDDDGRPKRTGTFWTATAHIVTAVIGAGVLSLAWAMAQLGWLGGPVVMIIFAAINLYTSILLTHCYRKDNFVTAGRNYTYSDAVRSILGGRNVKMCALVQYLNLIGIAIGYTIAASYSMMAIKRSNCYHRGHKKDACRMSSNVYMIAFGIVEVVLSQIPHFSQVSWLSTVAAVMSVTYSGVGFGLGLAKVAENGTLKGTWMGNGNIWKRLQALGAVAFAYSFSIILIEIQDTIKSPPAEKTTMKKATVVSIIGTTVFYIFCGCTGYGAFGDDAPDNLLTGFGFYNPYWLFDVANIAVVVHLVGAYQVFSQPLFAFVEKWIASKYPRNQFVTTDWEIPIPWIGVVYQVNLFRLIWRTSYVVFTTIIAMALPFFGDIVGILGAFGFWPLAVYFPISMYLSKNNIERWSKSWMGHQGLIIFTLLISALAAVGSISGLVLDLKFSKPFKSGY